MQGASGKPPASSNRQQLCRKQSPMVGNDAPTLACGHGLQPYGTLDCFKGRTEGVQGASGKPPVRPQAQTPAPAGNDAPTPAREKGLQPYGALTLFFRWRKKSVQKKASGTATLAARPAARRGLRSAVAPSGLSSTSVRFAHPSGEKALYCPFLKEGVRNVARSTVGLPT